MNSLGSTCVHNATYQVSRALVYWFWKKRFFKVFTIYGHGGHLGHVTRPFEQFFVDKGPGDSILNLVKIGPAVLEKKSFEIVDGRTDGRRSLSIL